MIISIIRSRVTTTWMKFLRKIEAVIRKDRIRNIKVQKCLKPNRKAKINSVYSKITGSSNGENMG